MGLWIKTMPLQKGLLYTLHAHCHNLIINTLYRTLYVLFHLFYFPSFALDIYHVTQLTVYSTCALITVLSAAKDLIESVANTVNQVFKKPNASQTWLIYFTQL